MKYFFYKIIPLSLAQLIFLFAQDRPSIDWKEIVTENYKIIFPKEIAEEGQRVANLMEKNHLRLQISFDDYSTKTPIVLRNNFNPIAIKKWNINYFKQCDIPVDVEYYKEKKDMN